MAARSVISAAVRGGGRTAACRPTQPRASIAPGAFAAPARRPASAGAFASASFGTSAFVGAPLRARANVAGPHRLSTRGFRCGFAQSLVAPLSVRDCCEQTLLITRGDGLSQKEGDLRVGLSVSKESTHRSVQPGADDDCVGPRFSRACAGLPWFFLTPFQHEAQ